MSQKTNNDETIRDLLLLVSRLDNDLRKKIEEVRVPIFEGTHGFPAIMVQVPLHSEKIKEIKRQLKLMENQEHMQPARTGNWLERGADAVTDSLGALDKLRRWWLVIVVSLLLMMGLSVYYATLGGGWEKWYNARLLHEQQVHQMEMERLRLERELLLLERGNTRERNRSSQQNSGQ